MIVTPHKREAERYKRNRTERLQGEEARVG